MGKTHNTTDAYNKNLNKTLKHAPKKSTKVKTCHICHGKGKTLAMGQESCPACYGTGRNYQSSLMAQYCRNCKGTGKRSYTKVVKCVACNGIGKIYY